MITKAHVLAWTIAALSGGVVACEYDAPEAQRARVQTSNVVHKTRAGFSIEHFRHNGNDCYIYLSYAIACVRAEGGK